MEANASVLGFVMLISDQGLGSEKFHKLVRLCLVQPNLSIKACVWPSKLVSISALNEYFLDALNDQLSCIWYHSN
ncbi:hypothetical protein IEQ34_001553 [Dendrobium chrysotoxum]|uniref:Uncharacterized protein n=1 Tax=Dendrobium chrysotoxum TaxID=161865 RepID=A0AAV7H772_DENCH|nr:hypothetical protein IEQ34_001553 [Dendrobium chrysotoxum]